MLIFVSMLGGIINARYLGADGVGSLALFLLIPLMCFRFGNLGIGSGLAFFIARKEISSKYLLKILYIFSFLMSSISIIALIFFSKTKFSFWNDIPQGVFIFGLLIVPIRYLRNFIQRCLSGLLKINIINFSEVISSISYIFFLICLVVILDLHLYGSIISYVISELFVLGYIVYICKKDKIFDFDFDFDVDIGRESFVEVSKKILSYSKWNYLVMLLNFFLEQLPLMFLKNLFSVGHVGFFAVSKGLSNKIRIIPESFSQVLFPFTASSTREDATLRTNQLCRFFFLFMFLFVTFLALIIEPLIFFIYGKDFFYSVDIFYVLIPSILFYPFTKFITIHIAASGNSFIPFCMYTSSFIVIVVSCFLLVPVYDAKGAAFSISITYTYMFFLSIIIYKIKTGTNLAELFIIEKKDLIGIIEFIKRRIW